MALKIDTISITLMNKGAHSNYMETVLEYLDKYDIEINPIVKNEEHFYKWVEAYPFYNSVKKNRG